MAPVLAAAVPLLYSAGWASVSFPALNQAALQPSADHAVGGRVLSAYVLTWGAFPLGQLAVGAPIRSASPPTEVACA